MCWSAEADLVAGAVVGGLGVLCLTRVRRARDLPMAALPLLLGVHQLIEAAVWRGVDGELTGAPALWARTAWAVVALPLLPALVSVGVWCAGPRTRRAAVLAVLGCAVAAGLTAALVAHPVTTREHGHTLTYAIGIPYGPLLLAGYLLATIGALLTSADGGLRRLGLLTGAAALVSGLLWRVAFVSTWCALAALVSVVLLGWVRRPAG
ncbi:hypothetical protein C7C46_23950 [Streptomyces tateyamensis]|uniref:DUF998 domain-containing protein n=1 Tax=Streptomyces tateyamensis TaxID=565073 RepID=A0A2V4N0S2_9ACTN|nr:DUF6629 family protein [Streptomyces tateyamensis]PYC74473.1 hypothetical protein C7C46_23950 [Streptomyces tateyamensis]